jgi:phenylpyruvate tautomerase PptA (4-oxalocrotonate tautomerase family)
VPLIHVTLIENVFSQTQKQEMIQKLTDALVSKRRKTAFLDMGGDRRC